MAKGVFSTMAWVIARKCGNGPTSKKCGWKWCAGRWATFPVMLVQDLRQSRSVRRAMRSNQATSQSLIHIGAERECTSVLSTCARAEVPSALRADTLLGDVTSARTPHMEHVGWKIP